jgi:hypothetical protein
MNAAHWITIQNNTLAPRFSEREQAILDDLIRTERQRETAINALLDILLEAGQTTHINNIATTAVRTAEALRAGESK